ncbi:serine protease family S33 [Achlya hypogyna]|uniref:Serine protease family S33 n=1 Tax=Achlya hypogyna TaxID=1202772 RepID=A0A1V9ZB37_ACHHY|nr:serine protease family S33 [Achlya hypogyna]
MLEWPTLWPCDRLRKKVALLSYVLKYLHYRCYADPPKLYKQDDPVTAQLLAKCSLLRSLFVLIRQLTRCCVVQAYHPTWYLFNGHLQTLMVAVGCAQPEVEYSREILHLSDGGIVSLDWALRPDGARFAHDHPTVLLLHGLTGGSSELYIRVTAAKLMASGWRVVVMNARGCADTPVVTAKLFCAAYTQDLREAVRYLRETQVPTAALVAGGFSLGSNILLKYVGEEGAGCLLSGAVSVGNPYDLLASNRNLMHSRLHNLLYREALTSNLLRLFFEKSNAHEHFKSHPVVDLDRLRAAASVWEFDDRLTRHVFGYATVSDYYRDASCSQYLKGVRIPTLCLTAADDPISIHTAIPDDDCAANRHILLAVTEKGGHLGFFTGGDVCEFPDMWASNVFVQFCNAVDELVVGAPPAPEAHSVYRRLFRVGTKEDVEAKPTPEEVATTDQPSMSPLPWAAAVLVCLFARAAYERRDVLRGKRRWWY